MAERHALRADPEDRFLVTLEAETIDELTRVLGHRFARPELLAEALTHPSASSEGKGVRNYERLEFLGDRVLGLVVADLVLKLFPEEDEGALARRFAALVRREALASVAQTIELGRHLIMAKGERESGGAENPTNLANACEAVIGALYRDGGLEATTAFLHRYWTPLAVEAEGPPRDAKTALQELTQAEFGKLPVYRTISVQGPAHDPTFTIEVSVEGIEPAIATGASKRAAEQAGAAVLLEKLARRHE